MPALLTTLRDVRRTLATFAALEPMLRHEVEPVDLLGWSMLVAKAPGYVRLLAEQLPTVCGHALETGEALLRAHLYDRHSLFLAENDLPSPVSPPSQRWPISCCCGPGPRAMYRPGCPPRICWSGATRF